MVFPFFSLFFFLKVWFLTLETCVVYFWGCFCVMCSYTSYFLVFFCLRFQFNSWAFNTHKQSIYISLVERFLLWLARYQFCAFCKKTLLPFTIPTSVLSNTHWIKLQVLFFFCQLQTPFFEFMCCVLAHVHMSICVFQGFTYKSPRAMRLKWVTKKDWFLLI